MARILDILPSFEEFARKTFVDSPTVRESRWKDVYESVHPEVFEAFYAGQGESVGTSAVVRELTIVRERVSEGGPVLHRVIEELEPAVREALGVAPTPDPLHVLMVGPYSVNVLVSRLGDDVALFHCLEWFQSEEGSRVLVAHEDAHAWHRIALGLAPPAADAAWTAFSEGLATRVSRQVVPDRPEDDYFWFGHEGFEDWLPWCGEHRDELVARFREELDEEGTAETFFGAGLVEKRWRVGYYLADLLVGSMDAPLPELVALSVDEARAAVREALAASS
ncbi:MAG TPA: hypothetical protein VHM89_08425 [Acidimicrobiales bacterium]|nr:hypothetical protein [Acidimicrobiales bacterium]